MTAAKPEWQQHRVGKPSSKDDWVDADCQPLVIVSHVTHIETALDILSQGKIRARLVYDESLLNRCRILVVWVSPNNWAGVGYRYGNIEFMFDWKTLISGLNSYWVELREGKIPASRILLTDQDRGSKLPAYDPETSHGPWEYDPSTDKHLWNGSSHCLELLIEKDLLLDDVLGINFVDHNDKYCHTNRYSPTSCSDLGKSASQSGMRFIALMIGSSISVPPSLLRDGDDPASIRTQIKWAGDKLVSKMARLTEARGNVTADDESAIPLMRAAMHSYGRGKNKDCEQLLELLNSKETAKVIARRLIADFLDVPEHLIEGILADDD